MRPSLCILTGDDSDDGGREPGTPKGAKHP